jgi:protein-tyrosine-phosphatase
MSQPRPTILFLCTGNYYRSRYAELLFNARAAALGLPWRADSRGLALDFGVNNFGPIARSVIAALERHGLPAPEPTRFPIQAAHDDLRAAVRVIAVKEAEHRPLLAERYTGWEDRVEYWHVHDNDVWPVEETLAAVERHVHELLDELRAAAA